MFSTMTTEPSTTMPKSSAPSESRLAGMCFRSRQIEANNKEKGMVSATMIAPRTLPRKRKRIITTRMIPSVRLCSTVWVVKCSRSLLSMKGISFTPCGRMWSFSSCTFLLMPSSTGCASAPFCRATTPDTTSALSTIFPSSRWYARANWPSRIFGPCVTTAISFIRSAVPALVITTVFSISWMFLT